MNALSSGSTGDGHFAIHDGSVAPPPPTEKKEHKDSFLQRPLNDRDSTDTVPPLVVHDKPASREIKTQMSSPPPPASTPTAKPPAAQTPPPVQQQPQPAERPATSTTAAHRLAEQKTQDTPLTSRQEPHHHKRVYGDEYQVKEPHKGPVETNELEPGHQAVTKAAEALHAHHPHPSAKDKGDKATSALPKDAACALTPAELEKAVGAELEGTSARFKKEHGFSTEFEPAARAALCHMCARLRIPVKNIIASRMADFEYALKLVHKNTGQDHFVITERIMENPNAELSKMVMSTYGKKK